MTQHSSFSTINDNGLALAFQNTFGRQPDIITSAPGRVEFIGNHTDYNGGPVIGASIDRGVSIALALRSDDRRRLASDFQGDSLSIEDMSAGQLIKQTGRSAWTNYPLGVLSSLPAFGLRAPQGFDLLVQSTLPAGSGLSSSAAIELASALAFLEVTGQVYSSKLLARIGRHAENNFVGVPCGILDQGVSAFGRRDQLVFIDCLKMEFKTLPLPSEACLWVFNTHTKHALVDGLYAERHRECMLAASALGVSLLVEASVGKLKNASGKMSAAVARRARHVIEEIERVQAVVTALKQDDLSLVGQMVTASHRSSKHLFENSTAELDFLVDTLVATPNVYGARLTGGGFGGAVLALTNPQFTPETAGIVAETYFQRFRIRPEVLRLGVGDGAQVVYRRQQ